MNAALEALLLGHGLMMALFQRFRRDILHPINPRLVNQ